MLGPITAGRRRAARPRRVPVPRAGLALLVALSLGGCYGYPATRESAAQYHVGRVEQVYALAFVPGRADPVPEDRDALTRLRPTLRPDASATLVAEGPLALERASRVSRALGRPVAVDARAPGERARGGAGREGAGQDGAVLVLVQPAIVPDACTGAGQPVGRNLWTFDDHTRQRLLPPGCATAAMLLEQAADRRDLLHGRALEPGAAGPIARAADRYLRRNDDRPLRAEDRPGTGETSREQPADSARAPVSAAGSVPQTPPVLLAPQQPEGLPPASTLPAPR